jgi:hypothetical protein
MRFFISGQIDDVANVRKLMDRVKIAGHTITHDWTVTDVFLGSPEAKLKDKQETGMRAAKDIQGVVSSDVYVLLSDNEQVGKGMYVELGAALALNAITGKPKVYVIGKMNHMSVFYLHPAVVHMANIEEVIKAIMSYT